MYECQVNTDPKIHKTIYLSLTGDIKIRSAVHQVIRYIEYPLKFPAGAEEVPDISQGRIMYFETDLL